MPRKLRSRVAPIDSLEDRRVPAAVTLAGGTLSVSNPDGPLLVETTTIARQLLVTDNTGTRTFNNVTNGLIIHGTNAGDILHVDASVSPLNLNLTFNALGGDDEVGMAGQFNRPVTVTTGQGNDTFRQFGDVTVFSALIMSDLSGQNQFLQNDFDLDVAGNLALQRLSLYQMGTASANTLAVGGFVSIAGLGTSNSLSPLNVILNGQSTRVLRGKLEVIGTAGNDIVSVTSQLSVNGHLLVNLYNGNNGTFLNPAAGGTGIAASTRYTGGIGNDIVSLGSSSNLVGATFFEMGNGDNTFVDTATSRYSSSVDVRGGSGTDITAINGQSGPLNISTGDGNNDVTVLTGKITGSVTYRSGNGNNGILNISPTLPQTVTLNATFGRGTKILVLGPKLSLTGSITGTGGTYSFFTGSATLLPSLVLRLFP